MSSTEAISKNAEKPVDTKELESINQERREALRDSLERAEQEHKAVKKEALTDIKGEALDNAQNADVTLARTERSPAEKRTGIITRSQRDQSFNKQLESIKPHLSSSEQRFSKLIHTKSIENLSETVGNTVARPNALLSGSIAAFLLVTVTYLLAKHYGYQLSGFETIGAFALGWVIGLIYDYARLLLKSK